MIDEYIINVGTTNQIKLAAVSNVVRTYISDVIINSYKTDSGVPDQPLTEHECLTGAQNRAKSAFEKSICRYGLGIESGIRQMVTGEWIEQTYVCAYDGVKYIYGISPGWQVPQTFMDLLRNNHTLNDVAQTLGYTTDNEIGKTSGIIGLLTNGLIDRQQYTEQALHMLLVNLTF